MICKEISRLKNYIDKFPNLDIWIVSSDKTLAKCYWESIKEYIKIDKKPVIMSTRGNMQEGFNSENALIILCGKWYKNSGAVSNTFRYYLKNAKITFPIGEIPCPNNKCDWEVETCLEERVCQ